MKVMNQHELKRTIKMQTKFKDIAQYYLGTGLVIRHNDGDDLIMNATGSGSNFISIDDIEEYGKPLLRSLDSLTKPITVKGYNDENSFVPAIEINKVLNKGSYCLNFNNIEIEDNELAISFGDYAIGYYINDTFKVVTLLCSWHINIFNLEETEYIKID